MLGTKTSHKARKTTDEKSGSLAFQRWHQSYIEKNEPGALNKILKEFYATVCKKDREDYKPEPLCSVYCY